MGSYADEHLNERFLRETVGRRDGRSLRQIESDAEDLAQCEHMPLKDAVRQVSGNLTPAYGTPKPR